MKSKIGFLKVAEELVAPVRERGLKYVMPPSTCSVANSRSREGAWIEIRFWKVQADEARVAPVRERGLKSAFLPC